MNRTYIDKKFLKKSSDLQKDLKKLDHKSYGMYKGLQGSYDFDNFILHIDHVQGDPFASPSRMRVEINQKVHGFPRDYYQENVLPVQGPANAHAKKADPDRENVCAMNASLDEENVCAIKASLDEENVHARKVALEDQILRKFRRELARLDKTVAGSGKSGRITTCPTGQKVLERIAVICSPAKLELRFEMGFPARGRTILADEMSKLLFDIIPALVQSSLIYKNWRPKEKESLKNAIFLRDDQYAIRKELVKRKLTAFIADGSILPRENGISDLPMKEAITFASNESMRVELTLPHKGKITGMGIPEGVTTIVGGGYHGKSTLLKALEQGVYDHIAGDGREYVITRDCAMKIRAEDGRAVNHTDISMFINHLPTGQNTSDFSTENASGSTSQAANLMEALEAGSNLLLIDEDTSATNFMIRDAVMSELVSDDQEPITPLIRKIRYLYEHMGVSFIIVVGSSGDYLGVSDHVIQMDRYKVKDVTEKAKNIAKKYFSKENNCNSLKSAEQTKGIETQQTTDKVPDSNILQTSVRAKKSGAKEAKNLTVTEESPLSTNFSKDYSGDKNYTSVKNYTSDKNYANNWNYTSNRVLYPKRIQDRIKTKTVGTDTIMINREVIDIRYLEQLCDSGQANCLAYILLWILQEIKKPTSLKQLVDEIFRKMDEDGLIALIQNNYPGGHPVRPRNQELYSCLNRFRSLKMIKNSSSDSASD